MALEAPPLWELTKAFNHAGIGAESSGGCVLMAVSHAQVIRTLHALPERLILTAHRQTSGDPLPGFVTGVSGSRSVDPDDGG